AQITRALLDQELLGADDSEQNALLHQAIQAEIRNEIEKVNADLRRARLHEENKTERIRELADYKLLLRRLSWEGDYRNTGLEDQEVVRAMLP
ncbi:hypothetical protein, partial [Klebsiella pneumoniae]|uniref:hypothetical protein n=1 Tax=Klebsiella pneumoniae TaxID=573 RepID=UPI00273036D7